MPAGIEELVSGVGPGMADLAVCGGIHLPVAAKAALMKSALESGFVLMIKVDILLNLGQVFGAETFDRMAIPAGG